MNKYNIHLKGFKCFKDSSFELNNLTLLTGANAAGKSSFIQSLLLVNSALERIHDNQAEIAIPLSDEQRALDLGVVDNLINVAGSDDVCITVNGANYFFLGSDDVERGELLMHCPVEEDREKCPVKNMVYLCAERVGPRYEMDFDKSVKIDCGSHGQNTASVIYNNDFSKVVKSRTFKGEAESKFLIELDAWTDYLFPGITVRSTPTGSTKCQVKVSNSNLQVTNVSTNVGFGICYALPVLVTCLLASDGQMIVIENPEAHLHAKGQSNMGYFLGIMAASGLRLLVETHSEHIINGIRRALASQKGLSPEDLTIYFLDLKDGEVVNQEITIDSNSNLSAFPVDFFDQQRQDTKKIFELLYRR